MLPIVVIKKGKEKAFVNRHPWIFSGAVERLPKAEDGDIIKVFDVNKQLIGYGFYDANSQIVCRVFEYTHDECDVENTQYWSDKVKRALEIRKQYVRTESTNCYRLIHAEGDFFPGLIADVYNDVLVLHFLIKGTLKIKEQLTEIFKDLGFKHICFKYVDESSQDFDKAGQWLHNPLPEGFQTLIKENGIVIKVDIVGGQKTGFFIDQRENRNLLAKYSKQKKVLNTFSYTGGFSLYALKAGAELVHSVDISESAIQLCDENVKLNFDNCQNHQSFVADCFDYLRSTSNSYDVIVIDPPAFAKSTHAVQRAARGYKDLNMIAFKKINPGGIIFTFSCSQKIDRDLFRKIIFSAAADAKRNVRVLHQLSQALDHPINIYHPEGEYLKGLVLYVE